jgi:hypothetical protein
MISGPSGRLDPTSRPTILRVSGAHAVVGSTTSRRQHSLLSPSSFCKNIPISSESLKMALANRKAEKLDRPDEYQKIFQ